MVEDHRQVTAAQAPIPVYDLRGLKCPLPVLKTRNYLKKIPTGALLWIEATDPMSSIDLPHFCTQEGHILIKHERSETLHRFLIQKK